MERRGTLKSWNDRQGFGFIRPEQGGEEVFVHVSAVRGGQRPMAGDPVLYVLGHDRQGRPRAEWLRLEVSSTRNRPPRRLAGTVRQWPAKLLVLALLCLLPLVGSLYRLGSAVPLMIYALANLLTFWLYWRDKRSALKDRWRTPETTLHLFELAGGWPGALLAQQLLRHKTRKPGYQLLCWAIVALHQAFWIDLLFIGGGFTRERWDWLLRLL